MLDDLRVGLVTARQDESGQSNPAHVTDASLVTRGGSILDSANDAAADVVAIRIDLKAGGTGGIGVPENDLEINSSTAGFATGRLFAEAGGSIYITETENELVLLAAKALTGNVRLTVPDTNGIRGPPFPTDTNTRNATPEDLDLLVCGADTAMCRSLVAESEPRVAAPSTDSARGTLSGIWAKQNVYLWVGDDIDEPATYEIVAGGTIYIHGDANRSNTADATDPAQDVPDEPATRIDAGWGTNMHFAGRVGGFFDPVLLGGTGSKDKTDLTLIFGHFDVDYFDFDHTDLGAKTRVFGSDNEIAQDAGPSGDGEDLFVVDHLQHDGRRPEPHAHARRAGRQRRLRDLHRGQPRRRPRLRDQRARHRRAGAESAARSAARRRGHHRGLRQRRHRPGARRRRRAAEQQAGRRHLPAAPRHLDRAAPARTARTRARRCGRPSSPSSTPTSPARAAPLGVDGYIRTGSFAVERINYSADDNGRLQVYGQANNDLFVVDDNSAITTLDGGSGNDTFQIGQIYGLQRDADERRQPERRVRRRSRRRAAT